MKQELKDIRNNSTQRESLRTFMYEALDEITLAKAYAGESILGIPEAKQVIDTIFDKFDTDNG